MESRSGRKYHIPDPKCVWRSFRRGTRGKIRGGQNDTERRSLRSPGGPVCKPVTDLLGREDVYLGALVLWCCGDFSVYFRACHCQRPYQMVDPHGYSVDTFSSL